MRFELNGTIPFIHKVKDVETRATVNWPSADLDVWFGSGYENKVAGIKVTEETALKHAAYWRAINLLSSQIGSFPIGLYKRFPNGDTDQIKKHSGIQLLTVQPNQVSTPFVYRESMQANVLTWGNAYSFIKRDRSGTPLSLHIQNPVNVNPKSDGVNIVYDIQANTGIDPYFILHIPGLSFDGVKGKAPIQVAAESIGNGLALQKFGNDFFSNGAKQSGVLMHPMAISLEAIEKMRKSFNLKMKDKDGGTMILDEGMKYQPLTIPPDQAQFLESRKFSVDDIARWFGIPPHLLFEETRSTFNNIAEQGISFVMYTLTQWVERWEDELNRKLLTEWEREDHFYKFNMNSLMRGNAKDRFESYRTGLDLGVYSINEVRRIEELNSIEGGDEHLVQINREPINKTKQDGK